MIKYSKSLFIFCLIFSNFVYAKDLDQKSVQKFINYMESTHNYDVTALQKIFKQAKFSNRVLKAISKPAEALPWYKYRLIFLQPERVEQGIMFWERHKEKLLAAQDEYGVPAEIIVAIIGVETRYGKFTGNDRVLDALATLAFHYPKRSKFFRGELEQYLLLIREQKIDPYTIKGSYAKGSYAGAMGIPQFISSSYRNYAIDFDADNKIDIWNNPVDAIGSVANYFKQHGWKAGEEIAVRAEVEDGQYLQVSNKELKPDIKLSEITSYGIKPLENLTQDLKLKILSFENKDGNEIWLGFNNFYVITRYNHSPLYAMAVYQLAVEITKIYKKRIAYK
jgi:membrane-bound lytic murein transglycosylase B